MIPIRFNDSADYQHMEVLGVSGVFTPLRIAADSLPEGFYKYSLREGDEEFISEICKNVVVNHAGDFITKEQIDLGAAGSQVLAPEDWGFTGEPFVFEQYFGCKLTLDCQIDAANKKRDGQDGGKSRGKSHESMIPEQELL